MSHYELVMFGGNNDSILYEVHTVKDGNSEYHVSTMLNAGTFEDMCNERTKALNLMLSGEMDLDQFDRVLGLGVIRFTQEQFKDVEFIHYTLNQGFLDYVLDAQNSYEKLKGKRINEYRNRGNS